MSVMMKQTAIAEKSVLPGKDLHRAVEGLLLREDYQAGGRGAEVKHSPAVAEVLQETENHVVREPVHIGEQEAAGEDA